MMLLVMLVVVLLVVVLLVVGDVGGGVMLRISICFVFCKSLFCSLSLFVQ